ncbi:transferrin receptor protein 2 [Taeniopygia guttata]|uniref:transferrin receptor protein 2 n=1 Tax=Taeniopygia guttata TaxID=59729 RepID=UPI003BB896EA
MEPLLRRCFLGRPPMGGGPVSYSRHRDPPRAGEGQQEEEEDEDEEGAEPTVRLPRPRPRPQRKPRPRLHPWAALGLSSAAAFLLGLLLAAIGRAPCGGVAGGAGPVPGGSAPDGVWGGANAEAPPPRPRLRELLRRHLRAERVEAWVREVSAGPHGAGSGRGRALAQSVLSALGGAGLSRAWSRPQPLPLPVRGEVTLSWVGPGGEELERLPLDPDAFCAWSAPGTATGGLVFGHYGRPQDLEQLRARGAAPRGNLVLLRLGRGGAAEKVAAAAAAGAVGVLLFPDPRDSAGPGGGPGLGGNTAVTLSVSGRPPRPPALGGPGGGAAVPAPPGGAAAAAARGGGTRPGTLTSVFGALRGRLEPDCYVIVGAQRDSLGPGAAASGVGTALLLELARFFAAIGREGFQLRRTLLFASWDGAEFGHLGATEWLEGYPGLLHTKVAAYISLDRAVLGAERLVVRASPTLGTLVESALEQVESPNEGGKSLLEQLRRPGRGWESDLVRPLSPEGGAFPFTAAAGVPALEFSFDEPAGGGSGAALGTAEDTLRRLGARLRGRLPAVAEAAAAVAAQLLLRLGHEPRLPLDPGALGDALVRQLAPLQARGLSLQCLSSARGGVVRAAAALRRDMAGADGGNERLNRGFNARLMAAEASLLSPFVSPLVTPFRHVLLGRGGHTLRALVAELGHGDTGGDIGDIGDSGTARGRLRVALLAWTLRGTAGALAGDSGDLGDMGGAGDSGGCGHLGDIGGDGRGGLGDIGDTGGTGDTWAGENKSSGGHAPVATPTLAPPTRVRPLPLVAAPSQAPPIGALPCCPVDHIVLSTILDRQPYWIGSHVVLVAILDRQAY